MVGANRLTIDHRRMFPARPPLRRQPIMLIIFGISIALNVVLAVLVHNAPAAPIEFTVTHPDDITPGRVKDVTVSQPRAADPRLTCSKKLNPNDHPLLGCPRSTNH